MILLRRPLKGVVREVVVAGDGFDYICQPIPWAMAWQCAKCKRGVLRPGYKKCKVCKRPVVFRFMSPSVPLSNKTNG